MTELAFTILALAFAIQTVRIWLNKAIYRGAHRRIVELEAELDKCARANYELQTRINGMVAGQRYVDKHVDEWPDPNKELRY